MPFLLVLHPVWITVLSSAICLVLGAKIAMMPRVDAVLPGPYTGLIEHYSSDNKVVRVEVFEVLGWEVTPLELTLEVNKVEYRHLRVMSPMPVILAVNEATWARFSLT